MRACPRSVQPTANWLCSFIPTRVHASMQVAYAERRRGNVCKCKVAPVRSSRSCRLLMSSFATPLSCKRIQDDSGCVHSLLLFRVDPGLLWLWLGSARSCHRQRPGRSQTALRRDRKDRRARRCPLLASLEVLPGAIFTGDELFRCGRGSEPTQINERCPHHRRQSCSRFRKRGSSAPPGRKSL